MLKTISDPAAVMLVIGGMFLAIVGITLAEILVDELRKLRRGSRRRLRTRGEAA